MINKRIQIILISVLTIFIANKSMAQQVWPVILNGSLVGPRSLDLDVYTSDRVQDLFFNAVLNDPTQVSLQVRIELSIKQNGNILYRTDPNFAMPPITLNQFQLLNMNGNFLQPYLRPEALVGSNFTGTGSLVVPEGFNEICLQVWGIDRNVPISDEVCISGVFELNQPPQVISPMCGEKMELPDIQNQLFTWAPMHLASGNNPQAVEYEFELVQLPQGTYNANDAFESALRIYTTRTMLTSIQYTTAQPLLLPNRIYAWRVRATSINYPTSTLFQNEGIGAVCTFLFYDGEEPSLDITAKDNPSPRGCLVFNTDAGPITNTKSVGIPLSTGDELKIGYFTLVVDNVRGGVFGFEGSGMIEVPMLNTVLKVNFKGVKVNTDYRIFRAKYVHAEIERDFFLDQYMVDPSLVGINIDEMYVKKMKSYFSSGKGTGRLTSRLDLSNPQVNILPVGMDKDDAPIIAVVGMAFTPRSAGITLVSMEEQANGGTTRFAGSYILATPYGIKNGAHLVNLNEEASGMIAKRMNCDCNGFTGFELNDGSK